MVAKVTKICRYPVKGLSPEFLLEVSIESGGTIKNDRRFALAVGPALFDSKTTHWLPKNNFLALMRNENLAKLETVFHDKTDTLQILQNGKEVINAKLNDEVDCAILEDFFSKFVKGRKMGNTRLVEAQGDTIFTDQKQKLISIINLASVRDLEQVIGKAVDPIRFRANIYVDGIGPWSEFDWVDKRMSCGNMIMEVKERIDRCAAINVDPLTGERDIDLVNYLRKKFGHIDMGVFAEVKNGGHIAVGNIMKQYTDV